MSLAGAPRTGGDPLSLVAAVKNAIYAVDKDQLVFKVITMEKLAAESITLRRPLGSSPLQFWEKAIPKADRLSLPLTIRFISNRVIQGFMRLAEGGTPLGYVIRMATGNRRAWSQASV
jgi:hypothetical protein